MEKLGITNNSARDIAQIGGKNWYDIMNVCKGKLQTIHQEI